MSAADLVVCNASVLGGTAPALPVREPRGRGMLRARCLTIVGFLVLACLAREAVSAEGARGTPRATLVGFLEAARAGTYDAAATYLDLRRVRAADGARLARELKVVLDQTLWIEVDALSDLPEGHTDDGLPRGIDSAGTIEGADPAVDLLLRRQSDGRWLVDGATVSRIGALYEQFGFGPLGRVLPQVFFEVRVFELELWQWIGLLACVVAAYVVGLLGSMVLLRVVARLTSRTQTTLDDRLLHAVSTPLTATLTITIFYLLTAFLFLPVPVRDGVGRISQGVVLIAITWLAMRISDVAALTIEERLTARGDTAAATIVPMGRRLVKVFLLAIALLSALQNLGFNITGLIAGLGIGGLAVALAAQSTFENFLGGVSVIADRPVQVGQFGRYGSWLGTIEAIGLRSTRIRTLDRTVVTIPNAAFASMEIENFAHRDRVRFHITIGLRYETSAEQLRHALVELKRLLASHARVDPDPARVRFVGFGASSLDVEIFCYVTTADWNEFLAIREDLLLRIMDVVEASGTGFAFPSHTVYLGKDDGLDADRSRAAETQVSAWREGSELPLPDVPEARLHDLKGTIPFPAEGAATADGSRSGRPPTHGADT